MTKLTVVSRAAERVYLESVLNKLTRSQFQSSFSLTTIAYKEAIFEEKHTNCSQELKNWLQIHDALAVAWGFYGDLDIYWPEYSRKLSKLLTKDVFTIRKSILDAWLFTREKQAKTSELIERMREQGQDVIII